MKNKFKFLLFAFGVLASLFLVSCESEVPPTYEGDARVHFIAEEGDAFVTSGTGYTDYLVNFGALNNVSGNKQVKLVVDAAQSNAIEGVDFQILNNATAVIENGKSTGNFVVRVFEATMSQTAKHAMFKLQSSDLANATFKQEFLLSMTLTCPVSTFVGDFQLTASWFWSAGDVFEVIQDSTPNQLRVVGFMADGSDFILKYNPDTYVVTFDTQSTGYFHSTYGAYILIRPATDVTKISTFNPCTRKMTLYMDYWMNGVGGWSNQSEVFSGI